MPDTRTRNRAQREVTINLRASRKQRLLIDQAADALGRTRSDFMLDASCREAESVLLDQRYLTLDAEVFEEFTAMLDSEPAANPRLRRLLAGKAPWDQ